MKLVQFTKIHADSLSPHMYSFNMDQPNSIHVCFYETLMLLAKQLSVS